MKQLRSGGCFGSEATACLYILFFPPPGIWVQHRRRDGAVRGGEHGGINFGTDVMSGRAVLKAEGLQGGVLL